MPSYKIQVINLALLAISLALTLWLFWGGLANVVGRWGAQPEYSHGYLIPLVSLYLLWEKKGPLAQHFHCHTWLGTSICLLSLALLTIGEISALFLLIHYAFVLFLFGLSVTVLGAGARLTLVPIAMLCFAIPLPYFIEVILTAKMQLLSSQLGVQLIRGFNIPVYLSGNIIDLGEFKLHVVEACSGLRYLFPLACLGFIAAYFYRAAWWKKILLFVSTVPLTIVMNSARIAIAGLLVEHFGIQAATGFLHDFEGWLVFVVCLALLLGEIKVLELVTSRQRLVDVFRPLPKPAGRNTAAPAARLSHPLIATSMLLLASIYLQHTLERRWELKPPNKSLASFPMALGQWRGQRDALAHDVVEGLQFTDYVLADYQKPVAQSDPVNFYVAYYDSQRKGVSPHSPKVCMPGGGWEIAEFERTEINAMPVNRAVIRKGNKAQLVYYWFIERGEVVANEYRKKWLLLRDALAKSRSDGSLVRVVTPIRGREDIADAEARVEEFVALAHARILSYLPGE